MKLARLVLCSLLWLPAYAALTVLWLLGHPVCLWLGWRHDVAFRVGPLSNGETIQSWRPRWAWLWSNPEDDVDGPRVTPPTSPSTWEWWQRTLDWPFWRRAWSWSAMRNSVSNERMLWEPVSEDRVEWIGNSTHPHEQWKADPSRPRWLWYVARQGLRTGLWILRGHGDWSYSEIRIGWKIIPAPARENERHAGLGLQFHWRRKMGVLY